MPTAMSKYFHCHSAGFGNFVHGAAAANSTAIIKILRMAASYHRKSPQQHSGMSEGTWQGNQLHACIHFCKVT